MTELKNAGQQVSCVSEGLEYLRDDRMEMNAEELEATLPLMQLSIANPNIHNNYSHSSASLSSSLPSDHDKLICNDFTIQSPIDISNQPILNLREDDCITASPFLLPANASTWDAPSFINVNSYNWPNYNIYSSAMADSTTSIFSPNCDNHILDPSYYHHRSVDLSLGTQLYASPNTNAPSPLLPHSNHPSLYSTTNMQSLNNGFQHMLSEYYPESHPCTPYSSPDYSLHSHKVETHVDFIGNDRPFLQHDSNFNMPHQKQNSQCSFLQHEGDVHQEGDCNYLTTSMMVPGHHQFGEAAGYPIVMMNHSQSVPIYLNHLCRDNISPNKQINDTSACRNQLKVYKQDDENDKAFVKPSNKRPAPDGDGEDWPPAQCSPPLKRSASWNCNDTLNVILDHTNEKPVAGVSCKDLSPNTLEPTNTKQESPTLMNLTTKAKARQNVAKDPQSIAARNRRERISERLKILQQLVPNGSKVDLVTMLEKAISYVKSLQLQVKVLATDEYWPTPLGDKFSLSNLAAVAKLLESTGQGVHEGYQD